MSGFDHDPDRAPEHPRVSGPTGPAAGGAAPVERVPVRRRGPGWVATVAVGVGAGLLSGALAAGAVVVDRALSPAAASTSVSAPAGSSSPGPGSARVAIDEAVDWGTVADRIRPSVVTITVRGPQGGGEGTGVVLDEAGHVVTNNHVATAAGPGAEIRVTLSDGRLYRASIVGTDPSTDLAVLKLEGPPQDLEPATFGDSDAVTVGQPVLAAGNPLGLSDTVTTGIISALNRPVVTGGQGGDPAVVTNALQTDASINPGNSGGPLVDARGEVIGINSSIASPSAGSGSAGSVGLGFAIPSNEVQRIATELVEDGDASHAQLGVTLAPEPAPATAGGTTRRSAAIASVVPGSPADAAGLRAGDQVVAVDEVATPDPDSLVALVRQYAPGDQATLTVVRDGQTTKLTATLQQGPR